MFYNTDTMQNKAITGR